MNGSYKIQKLTPVVLKRVKISDKVLKGNGLTEELVPGIVTETGKCSFSFHDINGTKGTVKFSESFKGILVVRDGRRNIAYVNENMSQEECLEILESLLNSKVESSLSKYL